MSVVDLKKTVAVQADQILSYDSPAEIGVVNVCNHGATSLVTLGADGVDISLHHVGGASTSLRHDECFKVRGVHVDGIFFKGVCYLFSLNKDEPASLLKLFPQLFECPETHEERIIL